MTEESAVALKTLTLNNTGSTISNDSKGTFTPHSTTALSPQIFATTQLHLLSLEQSADTLQTSSYLSSYTPRLLASAGLALLNLVPCARRTGLGGSTVIEFEVDSAVSAAVVKGKNDDEGKEAKGGGIAGNSGIRVGDVVGVRGMGSGGKKVAAKNKDKDDTRELKGVISKIGQRSVSVALDKEGQEQEAVLDAVVSAAGRVWLCVGVSVRCVTREADVLTATLLS